jgi:chorismate dehydratase
MLAKILLKEYWKSNAEIIHAKEESFINEIKGTTAALVIGDRALQQRQISPFNYDLGEAWKVHTGLPFVFAAWVSNKQLTPDFSDAFNEANGIGLQCINEVAALNKINGFDLKKYYNDYISYDLDEEKKKGMEVFLRSIDQ